MSRQARIEKNLASFTLIIGLVIMRSRFSILRCSQSACPRVVPVRREEVVVIEFVASTLGMKLDIKHVHDDNLSGKSKRGATPSTKRND